MELCTSINKLTSLEHLDLSKCSKLKEQLTFIDRHTTFEKLDWAKCSKLKELSTYINKLIVLQYLHMSYCSQLELPTCIDKLIANVKLNFSKLLVMEGVTHIY